jgi:FemAB-related protein (PEP-CTERM system-associated)
MTLAKSLKADYLELRCRDPIPLSLPVSLQKISMTLALPGDPEIVWKAFTSKHRTSIRRAEKNGLRVQAGGAELLPEFYSVMEQSWRALGTPLYRRSYFERIMTVFSDETRIFVASLGSQPIGVAFNAYYGDTVEGMWAGGGPRARELQVNYFLYWEMIRDACLRGFRVYNLGRSSVDTGAEDFKKKWNAERAQLYWYFYRPSGGPMPQLNVRNPRYRAAIAAWKRLPLLVTRTMGPLIARAIP